MSQPSVPAADPAATPARPRFEFGVALGVTLLLVGAGGLLGLLAAALTPHVAQVLFQDPTQGYPHALFLQAAEEDKAAFGGDGVMLAVLAGGGLLAGLGSLLLARVAPLGAVIGLLVGGLVGGALAMAVAHIVVHGGYAAVPASAVNGPGVYELRPYVRGRVDFLLFPVVALVVFAVGNAPWYLRPRPPAPQPWTSAPAWAAPQSWAAAPPRAATPSAPHSTAHPTPRAPEDGRPPAGGVPGGR
jgi:hypothetical protein